MKTYRFWLLIIILSALALRLYNLTYHSLWFDEAISVHWAKQTIPRILEVGFTLEEDRLPPLYYLLLKGWANLFGFGETSVRSLSVVFGVLLVPVVAGIATLMFNRRVALYTAILVAFNPFLIWYSQEARMYAPAVFFSTLATWSFLQYCKVASGRLQVASSKVAGRKLQVAGRKLQVAGRKSQVTDDTGQQPLHPFILHPSSFILLFTLSAIAALYCHLYTGFLLPALGLWLIISYPRAWRLWLAFAVSGVIITLAYTPILLAIWRFSGEATPGNPLTGITRRAWWLLQSFTILKASLSPYLKTIIPLVTVLFAILAYVPQPQNSKLKIRHSKLSHPLLLVTLLLLFPFIIANILLLRNHLAFFGERYFIVMTPWLLMLAAVGAYNLGEWANIRKNSPFTIHHSPFIILLLLTVLPLPGQWSTSAAKEMWRQSVEYLGQVATPGHGILIHPDWVRYPFQYYFQGPGQTYAAFSNVSVDTPLDGSLQGVVGDHEVIWLIQSHLDAPDPNRLVEQWFATRYPVVTELYPPGITLKGYAPGYQLDTLPPEATPIDLPFENGMRLVGYQTDSVATATEEQFHPPSGWVHVTLYWTADHPITADAATFADVVPFVQLIGLEGIWGINLDRPTDALKLYPPTRWPAPAPIIRHDLDVNLNSNTPPGTYQLIVGLHGEETQHPLTQVEIR